MRNYKIQLLSIAIIGLLSTFENTTKAQTKTAANTTEVGNGSAKKIFDKYLDALGGKEQLESVRSIVFEDKISLEGVESTRIRKVMGNKFITTMKRDGYESTDIFDGEKYSRKINGQYVTISVPADELVKLKNNKTADVLNNNVNNVKTVGNENIEGKNYDVLGSEKGKYYFDSETHLLYKVITPQVSTIIKNYVTVDGLKFISEIEESFPGGKNIIKNNKITLNSGVSDVDFNTISSLQTVLSFQKLYDKYLNALGGKEKLEAVKSIVIESSIHYPSGLETIEIVKKSGNKLKKVESFMGEEGVEEQITVFDGEKGFHIKVDKTENEMLKDEISQLKSGKTIDALQIPPGEGAPVIEEKIDNKIYNVLVSPDGIVKYYFDAVTGLLFKIVSAKEGTRMVKNYMPMEGMKFISEIEIVNNAGQKVTLKVNKITLNSGVSDADFTYYKFK